MYYAVLSADQVHNNKDLLSQGWESLSYVRTGMVTSEFDCTHWNAKCFFFILPVQNTKASFRQFTKN